MSSSQPTVFLSHGGGPSFFMDTKQLPHFKGIDRDSNAAEFLRNFIKHAGLRTPKALLVFSAHWNEKECTINSAAKHNLYFDYGGFPKFTYELKWPVTGAPNLAKKVKSLLENSGIQSNKTESRGLDHGVFIPLMLVYPDATIPVIQVSLLRNMDMVEHLKIAESLSCLSNEDILIIGSGFASHAGMGAKHAWAEEWKIWLHDAISNPEYSSQERKSKLLQYQNVPSYKSAHPTPEHFMPIAMVCASAGYRPARILHSEFICGSLLNDHYLFPTE